MDEVEVAEDGIPVKLSEHFEVLASIDRDGRAAWLEAREPILTASDVPKVLGLRAGKPRLWYEKAGMLDRPTDDEQPEHAQLGHDFEPLCQRKFEEKSERRTWRSQTLLRSKHYPWLGCTLDAWQLVRPDVFGPLELKSTAQIENWPVDDEPSAEYQAQLQTQMVVTGTPVGSVSAIIGAPVFRHEWADFEASGRFAELMLEETERFMRSIRKGIPPVDDDPDTSSALRRVALDRLGALEVDLPMRALEWDEQLCEAKAALAAWDKRKRYFENLLMTAIGDADFGLLPGTDARYSYKRQQRKAYTVKATSYRQLRREKGR